MSKYQVSTSMTFDRKADRDTVAAYLRDKKALAMIDAGDKYMEMNLPDNTYLVECEFRIEKEKDRDEVHAFLLANESKCRTDKEGHIGKHLCNHDEKRGCENAVMKKWGNAYGD